MGTMVESAYIERLQEDIDIACHRLEEEGIEVLVLTVCQDSHRLSGSQKGKIFLEHKDTFIAEFVLYCQDKTSGVKSERETITIYSEQGTPVRLQESAIPDSIDSLNTPSLISGNDSSQNKPPLSTNDSTLNTPALPDILSTPSPRDNQSTWNVPAPPDSETFSAPALLDDESIHPGVSKSTIYEDDIGTSYENSQNFGTDAPGISEGADADRNLGESPHPKHKEGTQKETESKKNKTVAKTNEEKKESEMPTRRILRSSKNRQSSCVAENLPDVNVVMTRLKKAKNSNETDALNSEKSKTTALSKRSSKVEHKKAEATSEKKSSTSKSVVNSRLPLQNTEPTEMVQNKQRKICCSVCNDIFDTVENLNTHMAFHKALACHMCKKVFKTKDGLQEHKQIHINRNEYNECEQCDKVFKFIWQLGEHVEKIHEGPVEKEDGSYPCGKCGHIFKQQLHLKEHNDRNADCLLEGSGVQSKQDTDIVMLSEIHFTDADSGVSKKKTVKELLENIKLPAACEICSKTFDKMYNFKRHILHHSEVKPFKCVICGHQFQLEENHKKHLRLHELRPYYCTNDSCTRRFETKSRLDHHTRFTCKKAMKKPDLTCKECGHQSQSVQAMESHKRVHTGIKAFSCDICGKLLSTVESIERHKRVFHQEDRPHECAECGKRFKIRDTLKKHEKTHGEKKFKCEICGKACVESGNLKKHMMTHTKEKPFICDICGKTYGRRSLLDNHMRLHTGEKPYTCDIEGCNKAFRSYGNLKQHKASHAQGHSFICDICGKTFKLKSRMNHHRKSHIVDYRWPCDYCEQKFKSIFMYKNHLAKTHPQMKSDIEERTNIRLYQCQICQKMYGDKEDLTRHIYIHKGLKPFKCRFCGKAFNDKSNMKCHERIHTGEKKLSCTLCYKTFLQPRPLKLHMKNVHGQRMDVEQDLKLDDQESMKPVDFTDQECKTAVENVLSVETSPPQLLDMRAVSQAVIAEPTQAMMVQTYPTSLTQPVHLFPQLVKDFEPLMIVENY